jgi:hypothetical protein
MAKYYTCVDFVLEHIIIHSWQGEVIVHRTLWTSPLTPWISCSTVLCVAVTWVAAYCRRLPNTHSCHTCSPESCKVCKFWSHTCYISLEYIAEILLFLCTTWSLRPQKDAPLDCTFHKSFQSVIIVFKMEERKNVEAIVCHHILIKWSAVLFLSGPPIFQAATMVMFYLNYECAKCTYFYTCNIRWLYWSASNVIGCFVLMEVAIHFI